MSKLPEMDPTNGGKSIVIKYDASPVDATHGRSTNGAKTMTTLCTINGFVFQMSMDKRAQFGLLGMFEVQQAIIDYDDFYPSYTATCNGKPLQATVGTKTYNVSTMQQVEQRFVTMTLTEAL